MSFLDNFRLFAAANSNSKKQDKDDGLMSREEVKKKLNDEVSKWQKSSRDYYEDSVFFDKKYRLNNNRDKIFDEWAKNKVKEKYKDKYDTLDEDTISQYELEELNGLFNKIRSDEFFTKISNDYDDEIKKVAETKYSYQNRYPAYKMAKQWVDSGIEQGRYTTNTAAMAGVDDYIKSIRGGADQVEPPVASQPQPAEEEYVTINFAPGDSLGQKIIDAGLATDNGLWGDNGDVAYYANQMQLADPNMINAGSTFKLAKRK